MKILRYIFIVNILFFNLFTIVYSEDNKENKESNEKKGFRSVLDNRFFSIGLFSSADSIKTTVNIEFGFKIMKYNNFQIKSYTAVTGSKIYDDSTQMYQLGLMQKFTFGGDDEYKGEISISRYGFAFFSFGFLSFDPDKSGKFLFASPYYWEVGGGAGFNINVSKHVGIVLEFGGGLHLVPDGKELGYPAKINKAGFGRMSIGGRYYF
ncbi:hypothetical protein A9X75_03660 [Brachyspira hyodysenteriae]|uniref:hypothetical protein n=1 Tax=Brachyspira hyodysenteriae TaxID=159 RepID=UPI0011839A16|nr:hypothetical protein [Brachyspira hyodysenteriae]TVL62776.1 hypothetical protein A9X75_03660 [Brachyspira hyodysenteriae]TVL70873.1 hypothetical protein A9X74_07450 [Brachyspira hyodysenteriae]